MLSRDYNMPHPNFMIRSEYRAPLRGANNACGTEGCRSPGNLPRVYGMLNSEIKAYGTNIPSPGGKTREPLLSRMEDRTPIEGWDTPLKSRAVMSHPMKGGYASLSTGWSPYPTAYSEDCYDEGYH